MKKIIIVIIITAIAILGFLFFQKAQDTKIIPSQAEIGNSADLAEFSSLKGTIDSPPNTTTDQSIPEDNSAARSPFQSQPSEVDSNPKDSSSILTFAVIGDTQGFKVGNPNGNFQKVVKDIAAANPGLVLATGDLTGSCESYTECLEKHNAWKKIDQPLLSKTYAAMGNHDNVKNKGVKAWQDAFYFPTNGPAGYSETAYSFDIKNSHFVILDSDEPDEHQVDAAQRSWLDQDMAKNKLENTFIVFHEPAFPVSSKIGESLDAQKSDRDALWQIIDKYNVTAVFNGHEHIVSRRKIDSSVFPGAKNTIYQFVFGNTDSFNHDFPKPGVVEYASQIQGSFGIVSVNEREIMVKTFDSSNKELDSFTFSK